MATEIPLFQKTFLTGGDLTSSRFRFVKLNSSGQVVAVAAVTDVPVGVLQDTPPNSSVGNPVVVTMAGISKLEAGAAITLPAVLGVDSVGRAVSKTIGTDTTHYAAGQPLEAAGASGALISAVINCMTPGRCS